MFINLINIGNNKNLIENKYFFKFNLKMISFNKVLREHNINSSNNISSFYKSIWEKFAIKHVHIAMWKLDQKNRDNEMNIIFKNIKTVKK